MFDFTVLDACIISACEIRSLSDRGNELFFEGSASELVKNAR